MSSKRMRTSEDGDINLYEIGNSTSTFGEKAEIFLNIKINEVDSFEEIINHNIDDKNKIIYTNDDITSELKELFLDDFDRDNIRIFKPHKNQHLSKSAQLFLYKLSMVVNNNYVAVEPKHVEDYIHDLMENVLRHAKFEDGTELILMPSVLNLNIGEESFAARADKEGRRGTEIIWIIDEDKHRFDKRWKKGDIQLIANMIAAAQTNRVLMRKIYQERIMGIKFDADNVYFYSVYINEEYLNELIAGNKPKKEIIVNKFPKKELSLSKCEDRKKIFLYLCGLKKYAMKIEPIYID